MKAKELAEILLKYPDFDVVVTYADEPATWDNPYGHSVELYVDDYDVSYTAKEIMLDCC